jgi:hypothetical protein
MKKKMFFLTLALLLSTQMISAQQPEVIDVKTYTIYKEFSWSSAHFVMTAENSSGSLVTYSGTGNYTIGSLMNCSPCNMPNTFSSNGFFSESFGVSYNWAFDSPVQFRITSVEAEPIVLRPTILRKKRRFNVDGSVSVRGKIEIRAPGTILAVDNDVNLAGTYSAQFTPLNFLDGRKIQYTKINYTLNKAP